MRTDRNIKSKVARISTSQNSHGAEQGSEAVGASCSPNKKRPSKIHDFVAACKKLPESIEDAYRAASSGIPYYIPGLLLIAMACALILAPDLVAGFCAVLVMYLGGVTLYLGRKFRELQGKFSEIVKQIEARIYIRGQGWSENDSASSQGPDKKTVLH